MSTKTQESSESRNIVGTIQKTDFNQIRVSVDSYKGHEFVSVREWYLPREASAGNEYKPSQKGFTLPLDTIDETIEALVEALEEAKDIVNQVEEV
jgi:uncharacterized lipoprotein YmbA